MAKYKIYKCDVHKYIEIRGRKGYRFYDDVEINIPVNEFALKKLPKKIDMAWVENFSKWSEIVYAEYGQGNLIFPNQEMAVQFYNRYLAMLPTLEPLLAPVIILEVHSIADANKIRESVGRRVS